MVFLPYSAKPPGRPHRLGLHPKRWPSRWFYKLRRQPRCAGGLLRPAFPPIRPFPFVEPRAAGIHRRSVPALRQHPSAGMAGGLGLPGPHIYQAQRRGSGGLSPSHRWPGYGRDRCLRDCLLEDERRCRAMATMYRWDSGGARRQTLRRWTGRHLPTPQRELPRRVHGDGISPAYGTLRYRPRFGRAG